MAARVVSRLAIAISADYGGLAAGGRSASKELARSAKAADESARATARAGRSADQAGKSLGGLGDRARLAVTALLSVAALTATVVTLGKLAAQAETTRTAFEVMLGSASRAAVVVGELNQYAAATPFRKDDVIGAAKSLIAYGFAAEELGTRIRTLGDLAAGSGANIGELATIFGRARAAGVVAMSDINQLSDRAVPIFEALKQELGLTGAELRKFIGQGGVDFATLDKALTKMAAKGGVYFEATARQSKTLSGAISTLLDNVQALATAVGEKMLPALKLAAETATTLTNMIQGLNAGQAQTIAQLAAFGAGFLAFVVVVPRVVLAVGKVVKALRAWTTASIILQSTTIAGAALVVAAIAAGGAAAYAVGTQFDKLEQSVDETAGSAQALANEAREAAAATKEAAEGAESHASAAKEAAEAAKQEREEWERIGRAIAEEVATPAEKLQLKIWDAQEALRRGTIDARTYGRVLAKAAEELERGEEAAHRTRAALADGGVGAVARGSQAALDAEQAGAAAIRQINQERAERKQAEEKRDRLLAELIGATRSVEQAVDRSAPTVRRNTIPQG